MNEKMGKKWRRPVQICPRGLPEDGAATVAIEADRETHVVTDWLDRIGQDTVIGRTLSIVRGNLTVPIVPVAGVTGRVVVALPPDRTFLSRPVGR